MTRHDEQRREPGRRAVWAAGLIVAAGAGVATAHGLYQVAVAAHVPNVIAWLYPLITDGLALVAYAATSRLAAGGRRYAATIVVLAAGLSGLAQAVYLAGGIADSSTAPVGLRFGVGAWPAIAAALTAHLLHLISSTQAADDRPAALTPTRQPNPAAELYSDTSVQPFNAGAAGAVVQPQRSTVPTRPSAVQRPAAPSVEHPQPSASNARRSASGGAASSASDRARQAARSHYARHGGLPTATELMAQADVSRGTAGTVLKDLRDNRPALHIVNADSDSRTDQ